MKQNIGQINVSGNTPFRVPASDFMISPVSVDTNLYINRLHTETANPQICGEIKADEYTKVHGSVVGTEFYVDTTDDFIITYNYE